MTGSFSCLLFDKLNFDANPAKKLLLPPVGVFSTFGSSDGDDAAFGGIFNAANGVGVGSCPFNNNKHKIVTQFFYL